MRHQLLLTMALAGKIAVEIQINPHGRRMQWNAGAASVAAERAWCGCAWSGSVVKRRVRRAATRCLLVAVIRRVTD
jgi:hypothetical protein